MSNTNEITPVLVVGGGLVGLSTAVFLGRQGIPTVLVEKRPGSSSHPRAIGYTTRTIELLSAAGIELPPHDGDHTGDHTGPRRARVESLAGPWHEEYPWSPGSDRRPDVEYSPSRAAAIAQDRLEPILRARAIELGAAVRLDTELIDFTDSGEGITATVRTREGRHEQLSARFLVAADGVHSPVREKLAVSRSGQGLLSVQRSILFRAPLEEYLDRGIVQFEIEQPGLSAFLTTYQDGRWVLMLDDDTDVDLDEDAQRALIGRAIGRTDIGIELITTGRWELAALIADRFRAGRVFLVGDAAHQLPPNRGGYGANTGIEDAHNLAWKLAAVVSGASTPDLLDTYDAERRPIAWLRHEQIFARADYKARLQTAVAEVPLIDDVAMELGQLYRSRAVLDAGPELPRALRPDQWAGQPGTRAPHLRIGVGEAQHSTLDLFQHGWVLLAEHPQWRSAASSAADSLGLAVTFVHIGGVVQPAATEAFRQAYGIEADGATLVRPDGYIAWRAITAPADPTGTFTTALAAVSCAAQSPEPTEPTGPTEPTEPTMAQRIRRLEDIEAVKDLTARYATAVNQGWAGRTVDHEAIRTIFATDARWESRDMGIVEQGLDAIVDSLTESTAMIQFSMHAVLNPVITVDGDTAAGNWLMWVAAKVDDQPRGVYLSADMTYARTQQGWRIHSVDVQHGMHQQPAAQSSGL